MSSLFTHFFRKKRPSQFNSSSSKSIENILTSDSNDRKPSKSEKPVLSYDASLNDILAKPLNSSINTSSVFNTPAKKGGFLQGFYGVFEDHISDHLVDLLNLPEHTTAATIPSTEDFSDYMEKVSTSYTLFVRERENTTQESSTQEQIDVTGSLLKCYKKVPQQYFDPKFHFNFCMLSQEQDGLPKFQAGLTESLKLVEENLYHQISSKFGVILTAIRDLTDQEMRISNCIEAITNIRATNKHMNDMNVAKIKEVLKNKRKQMNMQRTVQTLEMMNLVKKIVPTLEQLIHRGNFDSAVTLLNSSEQTCTQRLGSIRCLQTFQANFQQARTTLQQLLITEFEKRSLDYFTKCLVYRKGNSEQGSPSRGSSQDHSPMDAVEHRKDGKGLQVNVDAFDFNWTLEEVPTDSNTLDQIYKIILAHIKLKEVSLTSYRLKLNEILRKFHKQIINDMTEQINSITSKSNMNQESIAAVVFEQRVKFMVFYFRTFKQFLTKFSDINSQVLSKIIHYFDDKMHADSFTKADGHDSDAISLKVLTETAQEFYSLYTVVIRNFIDKMAQIIQLIDLNNTTITQFLFFGEAFDEILVFLREKFDYQGRLSSIITTENETMKKALTKIMSNFLDQISISPITSLRLITEKQFIQAYYTSRKDEIVKKMKQDKWQAVDVSPDCLDCFKLLYDTSVESPESLSVTRLASTSTEASEANSAKIREFKEDGSLSPAIPLEQRCHSKDSDTTSVEHPSTMISIRKKTICINGNTYKVTESFIDIIQTVSELYLLSFKFSSIREESIMKILQLTKLFSSTVEHDILKGNAFSSAKSGVITPEILSIAAVSLSLIDRSIEVLANKVRRTYPNTYIIMENETNHTRTAIETLAEKLLNKISEILRDVVIIDNCNKLKAVQWTNLKEKLATPTSFSTQMLSKIKAVHKKIKNYLPQGDLNVVFRAVMDDLTKYYLGVFEEMEVETGVAAKRVKDELTCFMEELKKTDIFGDFELDLGEFEEKSRMITEHKCDPFIELASLVEEKEAEEIGSR